VPPWPRGHGQLLPTGVADGGAEVGGVLGEHDRGDPLVDAGAPAGAGLVETGVAGAEDGAVGFAWGRGPGSARTAW